MILGKLIFGFALGNVASTMANIESLGVKFEERFSVVQAYMKDHKLPLNLQQRVADFYQYIWRRNRGGSNDGLFDDLPPCLHRELCFAINGQLMQQVPLFKGCELPIIRLLCRKTRLIQFHQNEYIGKIGDIGNEMYFIKKGQIQIIEEDAIITKGAFFGDKCIFSSLPRKFTTRAVTHCDIFCLTHSDLTDAFMLYPEEKARIKENIDKFY